MSSTEEKLPVRSKIFYGSGEAVSVVAVTAIGLYFMYFLTDVVGLNPALAGTIFLIGRGWDAVVDPILGLASDRSKSRWGRRRPFFLFSAILLLVFSTLLWLTVKTNSTALDFIYYAFVYVIFASAVSMFYVPYLGLISELSGDYNERTSINNYRIFFQLIFGLVAATIPKLISDSFSDPADGYLAMGLGIGVFITLMALFIFSFSKEKHETHEGSNFKLRTEVLTVFKNRSFIYILIIYVGCYAAANVIEGFVIYYMKYWLNRELDMPVLFVTVILAGVVSLPFWTKLSKKYGKKRTLLIGLVIWGIAQFAWLLIAANSSTALVYVVGAVVGIGYGVAHVLPWAMLPDAIDMDELSTGRKREGLYSGVMAFFMQLSNSIAIFIIGLILQFSGYVANATQTDGAMNAIKLTMSFAPEIFILIGIIATCLYPYSREDHIKIRQQLESKKTEMVN